MREILEDVARWRAAGEPFALGTVVATRRSAPRPVGAKVGVSAGGALVGSVSGGCVESDVLEQARAVLEGAPARVVTYGIDDDTAFGLGLPCGGEIDVLVQRLDDAVADRLVAAVRDDEHAVHFTVLDGPGTGAELLVVDDGAALGDGPDGLAALAPGLVRGGRPVVLDDVGGARVFADVLGPPPRLLVFGAVDTADALCRAAAGLGWRTVVADARARFATPERLPHAGEIVVAWPDEALQRVRPDHATAVVVLTHDEKFDLPAITGALETEAFYIGALGSRRNQEKRRARLLEAGVPEAALDRVSGPCGLDLGAATPAETALSILAEILAVRAGRDGGMLKASSGRIHAEAA